MQEVETAEVAVVAASKGRVSEAAEVAAWEDRSHVHGVLSVVSRTPKNAITQVASRFATPLTREQCDT